MDKLNTMVEEVYQYACEKLSEARIIDDDVYIILKNNITSKLKFESNLSFKPEFDKQKVESIYLRSLQYTLLSLSHRDNMDILKEHFRLTSEEYLKKHNKLF